MKCEEGLRYILDVISYEQLDLCAHTSLTPRIAEDPFKVFNSTTQVSLCDKRTQYSEKETGFMFKLDLWLLGYHDQITQSMMSLLSDVADVHNKLPIL